LAPASGARDSECRADFGGDRRSVGGHGRRRLWASGGEVAENQGSATAVPIARALARHPPIERDEPTLPGAARWRYDGIGRAQGQIEPAQNVVATANIPTR